MSEPRASGVPPSQVAEAAGGRLEGDERDAPLTHLASVDRVVAGYPEVGDAVVVVPGVPELERLADAVAPGLVVLAEDLEVPAALRAVPVVRVAEPRLALARLSAAFDARPLPVPPGVDEAAVVHETARLGEGVRLGPGAWVGPSVVVGAGSVVGPGVALGEGSVVGDACVLHPGVTLYDGVELGSRVVLHAGCVIGADGFGYAPSPRGAVKVRQLGGVRLGDDVEIGANTAVDRGALDDTVVGDRTKIDNLCQVGHNVRIGTDCLIAGMTGIAGSVVIGNGVILGGAVAVSDHVSIGDGARIAGRSGVTKDVPAGETWAGFPARPYRQFARALYLQDRLEEIWHAFRQRDRG